MTEPATGVIDAAVLNPAETEERTEPAWGAVVSLALGVFGLVTAEFLPASLLTPTGAGSRHHRRRGRASGDGDGRGRRDRRAHHGHHHQAARPQAGHVGADDAA